MNNLLYIHLMDLQITVWYIVSMGLETFVDGVSVTTPIVTSALRSDRFVFKLFSYFNVTIFVVYCSSLCIVKRSHCNIICFTVSETLTC